MTVVVLAFVIAMQSAPDAPPLLSTTPASSETPAEPGQMSGMPLQVGDLPPGTVAVRVIRGSFANNVVGQPVELQVLGVNGLMLEEKTDASGRATFTGIAVGRTVLTRTSIDGQSLTSQQFEMPAQGGVRLVLVAEAGASATPVSIPSPPPSADVATLVASILGLATVALGVWWSRRWAESLARVEEDS